MTKSERARIIRELNDWFMLAAAREKLDQSPTSAAARQRHERKVAAFMTKHPNAGLITTAFLYDLFRLATEP